jgi:hypothetical protein
MKWLEVVGPIKILWPVSARIGIGSNISIEMVDKANGRCSDQRVVDWIEVSVEIRKEGQNR